MTAAGASPLPFPGGEGDNEYRLSENELRHSLQIDDITVESWVRSDAAHGSEVSRSPDLSDPPGQTRRHADTQTADTQTIVRSLDPSDPQGAWWRLYLDGATPTPANGLAAPPLRILDLFCGAGGLTLGVRQLAAETGRETVTELAVDSDSHALAVYRANHRTRFSSTDSVESLVDYRVREQGERAEFPYQPEILDPHIARAAAGADLVVAGPPCQGHSNLNNRSRRDDRRNLLYLAVPAFAVAADAAAVIIENVPSVVHDYTGVVRTTRLLLESAGYTVTTGNLAAADMGWPQTRRRFFLIARRGRQPIALDRVADLLAERDRPPRSVEWAIGGNQAITGQPCLDEPTRHSTTGQDRIDWLFDNDEHDLDLSKRPECHQEGTTYRASYGRLRPDRPAGTITTGYTTPGRGRFVHPTERRTLTPGEAARLQGFPSSYRFITDTDKPPTRAQLATWIGNAVPMPLGYGAALAALGPALATPSPRAPQAAQPAQNRPTGKHPG